MINQHRLCQLELEVRKKDIGNGIPRPLWELYIYIYICQVPISGWNVKNGLFLQTYLFLLTFPLSVHFCTLFDTIWMCYRDSL